MPDDQSEQEKIDRAKLDAINHAFEHEGYRLFHPMEHRMLQAALDRVRARGIDPDATPLARWGKSRDDLATYLKLNLHKGYAPGEFQTQLEAAIERWCDDWLRQPAVHSSDAIRRQFLELADYFSSAELSPATPRVKAVRYLNALNTAANLVTEAANAGAVPEPIKLLVDFHRGKLEQHPLWPEETAIYDAEVKPGRARKVKGGGNLFAEVLTYLRHNEQPSALSRPLDGVVIDGRGGMTLHGASIDEREQAAVWELAHEDSRANMVWGCKLLAKMVTRRNHRPPLPVFLDAVEDLANTAPVGERDYIRARAAEMLKHPWGSCLELEQGKEGQSIKRAGALYRLRPGLEHLAGNDPVKPDKVAMLKEAVATLRGLESHVENGIKQEIKIAKPRRRTTGKRLKDKPLTPKQREAADMIVTCNGSKTEAAKRLKISRAALDQRLKGVKLRGALAAQRSVGTQSLPMDRRGGIVTGRRK